MVQKAPNLKSRTIAITRPASQAEEVAEVIRKKGGVPYFIPTIEIRGLSDLSPIKKFIEELYSGKVDLTVFMSVNGVRHLFSAAEELKVTDKLVQGLKKPMMVAVGPRTAEELKAHQVHVNLVPTEYTSEGIAESLRGFDVSGKSVRIPRTTAANPILREKLEERGALVQEVYVYESALPADNALKEKFLQDLKAEKIQAIVFGSGLTARNLFQMLSEHISAKNLRELLNQNVTVVAIGPITGEALGKLGVKVSVMPQSYMFDEALAELAEYWNTN